MDAEQQKAAKEFALKYRVSAPAYSYDGKTVYNTQTGKAYNNEQQFFKDFGFTSWKEVPPEFIQRDFVTDEQRNADRSYGLQQDQFAYQRMSGDREFGLQQNQFNQGIVESNRNFGLQQEQLEYQKNATKFQLGTDAWGNPLVFNPRTGTYTGGDTSGSGGGSKPYYGLPPKIYDKAASIVNQFDGEAITKKYNVVADGNNFAQAIDPNTKNAAEHQALIYGLAKALDPDSVVREGEYATIQKYSQSWLEAFGFNAQRVVNNQGLLTADAIKKVQGVIRDKFNSVDGQYQNLYSEYSRRIDAATGSQGKGTEMLTDYSKAYKAQSDPTLNNLWGDAFTTSSPFDLKKAKGSGGLTFNSGAGLTPRGASPASVSQSGQAGQGAKAVFAQAYPSGVTGGQCGVFARNLLASYGYDYPRVGNSLEAKAQTIQNYGVPQNKWGVGTVLITSENKKYGHVPIINAITPKGYQVTESNYNLDEKVSHTRIIPFNSPKLIGGINPSRKAKTA
jgi:hypothetical protein